MFDQHSKLVKMPLWFGEAGTFSKEIVDSKTDLARYGNPVDGFLQPNSF
jgi:hypothetical protein